MFLTKNSTKFIQHFFELMFQNGLIPVLYIPTRINKPNSAAINHIIPNSNFSTNNSIIKTDISKLFPVFLVSDTRDISSYNDTSIKQLNLLLNKVTRNTVPLTKWRNKGYKHFLETFLRPYRRVH